MLTSVKASLSSIANVIFLLTVFSVKSKGAVPRRSSEVSTAALVLIEEPLEAPEAFPRIRDPVLRNMPLRRMDHPDIIVFGASATTAPWNWEAWRNSAADHSARARYEYMFPIGLQSVGSIGFLRVIWSNYAPYSLTVDMTLGQEGIRLGGLWQQTRRRVLVRLDLHFGVYTRGYYQQPIVPLSSNYERRTFRDGLLYSTTAVPQSVPFLYGSVSIEYDEMGRYVRMDTVMLRFQRGIRLMGHVYPVQQNPSLPEPEIMFQWTAITHERRVAGMDDSNLLPPPPAGYNPVRAHIRTRPRFRPS